MQKYLVEQQFKPILLDVSSNIALSNVVALFGYLLSLEDEKISGQTFQTQQIVTVGTDLDLVGQTTVIFSYNLVLEKQS